MRERRKALRTRAFRGGKILLTGKRSVIDCTVRNLSPEGACLQVENVVGIPEMFDLAIDGETASRACQLAWESKSRIGVAFRTHAAEASPREAVENRQGAEPKTPVCETTPANDPVRTELLALRAALDAVSFGVVLLDQELRAQFTNRAFRKMWRLPDAKADSKPAFVALMYHGRDTRAYEVPESELDAYVAERVALIKANHPAPLDIRLANGEVLRLQCTVLASGNRLLCYTYVTDIVRHSDELEILRAALDGVENGIVLLDAQLHAQFINRATRRLWGISEQQAERKPHYSELVNNARLTEAYAVPPDGLEAFIAKRIAVVRAGDTTPTDLRTGDGRTVRAQCAPLPGGGRMLTYVDVTDLVGHAEALEQLATLDPLTNLYTERIFLVLAEAEWKRFQRYHHPLSLLAIAIDGFDAINGRFGREAGGKAIRHLADVLKEEGRCSDILARVEGDAFAMLLPEADAAKAQMVAERLRHHVEARPFAIDGQPVRMIVHIGLAQATISMPGVGALMRLADAALREAESAGAQRIVRGLPADSDLKMAAE
jgi:diguanylate cyclase (GGDEF)-like protein